MHEALRRTALVGVWTVSLCWLLSSCALLPARRAFGPTATPVVPTATPLPLVVARGSERSFESLNFVAPFSGWTAGWKYNCSARGSSSDRGWRVTMTVVHAHSRQLPHSQQIVDASSHGAGSARRPSGAGVTPLTIRGSVYIAVRASPECSWSVRAVSS